MKHRFLYSIFIIIFFFTYAGTLSAQESLKKQISDTLSSIANQYAWAGNVQAKSITIDKRKRIVEVTTNQGLGYVNFREDNVKQIYEAIQSVLPEEYHRYKIYCKVDGHYIEDLIPNYFRRSQREDKDRQFRIKNEGEPLITNVSHPHKITQGLQDRHIALWQSHGWYYNQSQARWTWQRPRLFTTVEDLYTQSYVLPFLVPMLENAGAKVLLPRERDTQTHEVIVDNDHLYSSSLYREQNGENNWETGMSPGFANIKDYYLQGESPFSMGTYRTSPVTNEKDELSFTEWIPDIPETGNYAVYVSYQTLPNSTSKAHYTVYHTGGKTDFEINQTMYGGTWLYLGHFQFAQGVSENGKVLLNNYGKERKKVITADAVKFGGGMGNIARQPSMPDPEYKTPVKTKKRNNKNNTPKTDTIPRVTVPGYTPAISEYPRFTEGARYWLQWAGMPDSIYSRTRGENDYSDDFQSRGYWVNYVSGGSAVSPDQPGLKVPLDMAFSFHSDAGVTSNDSVIGTLAICTTKNTDKESVYKNGISRMSARDLTDIVQAQIGADIKALHAPEWVSRGIWDKSYSESRVPEVPTMLLECMSHQNFADMRYGLDPQFRFDFSRAIYKGILRYMESVYNEEYIVQPLPVEHFSIRFTAYDEIELHWLPVEDPLEPTAKAKNYIVYTRQDGAGFDNGILVNSNNYTIRINPDKIYSFKVTAVNKGGESFPSEILSACRSEKNQGEVLIVNAFDRISAPESFTQDSTMAGFLNKKDMGVPYIADISYTGEQYEFRRGMPWIDDDVPGSGASQGQYETQVIAGNTFDYPYLHGKTIKEAGYSFVSCSKKSIITGYIQMDDYPVVDIIMGKQKETYTGNGKKASKFKTFPLDLQKKIESYCLNGGNLFLSGAYIASDMIKSEHDFNYQDKSFIENTLKIRLKTPQASITGKMRIVESPVSWFKKSKLSYYDSPNSVCYYVESPDAIEAVDNKGYTICRYGENNLSAGIVYDNGNNKICVLGFPFETIKEEDERNKFMNSLLLYFSYTNPVYN